MKYEAVKKTLIKFVRKSILFRKMFYLFLDLILLRSWYVKKEIKKLHYNKNDRLKILDAGFGFGQYSYYCSRLFPNAEILGIDINESLVLDCSDFATRIGQNRMSFKKQELTSIRYKEKFDLILLIDVIEHIKEDIRVLNVLFIALNKGGKLIISTPSVYRKYKQDEEFVDEHYHTGYSEGEIVEKLLKSGFCNIELKYSYGLCGDLSWRIGIRNCMKILGRRFPVKLLAPVYFAVVFPVVYILMILDFILPNRRGTGFVITASKSD